MNYWTALTAKEVFLPRGKGDQCCYPITDCKEPGGQGQRSKTWFLWIREAAIPVLLKKVQKSMSNGKNGAILILGSLILRLRSMFRKRCSYGTLDYFFKRAQGLRPRKSRATGKSNGARRFACEWQQNDLAAAE
jgi:hypothetical protein